MALNYQPTQWNNEQEPPISAENLNHIEQGIKAVSDKADTLVTVEANPSSSATDRLTGLEVDGTTYEVGGGHKVYTDGGTLLPQQPNMVVKGVYSKDNSTNNITEIEVVREFQNDAEVQALTGEEAKGFQHTPDNVYRARSAADISFDPTNTLLTSTRMQEAMEELDASKLPYSSSQSTKQKIDEVNNNVPQMMQVQFAIPTVTLINADTTATVLNHFDIRNSTITDGLHDNAQLKTLLGGKTLLGFVFLYSNSSLCAQVDAIVWEGEQTLSLAIRNTSSSNVNISTVRLLVFYK